MVNHIHWRKAVGADGALKAAVAGNAGGCGTEYKKSLFARWCLRSDALPIRCYGQRLPWQRLGGPPEKQLF